MGSDDPDFDRILAMWVGGTTLILETLVEQRLVLRPRACTWWDGLGAARRVVGASGARC